LNSLKLHRLTVILPLTLSLMASVPLPSSGQSATPSRSDRAELVRQVKEMQRRMMLSGGLTELKEHREMARQAKLRQKLARAGVRAKRTRSGAIRQKPARIPELGLGRPPLSALSSRSVGTVISALGPNVLANDTTGDRDNAWGQSEPAIGATGDNVVAAWNNGKGFSDDSDLMAYGYSTDGGVTFHDGGAVPRPSNAKWSSDPVVIVNEKTSEFYFVGLIETSTGTRNGLAIARGTFSGTTLTWGTAFVIRDVSNSTDFIDKPWAAVDSSSGRIYVSYTHFFVSGSNVSDKIEFQRSAGAWNAAWSTPMEMNSGLKEGYVQGSRPAVGPSGEVYVVWKEIGLTDADYFRIRKSTNQGSAFSLESTAATIYDNFGTGAPGFNRERGITFPAIAVDRSTTPNRGRVYVAWSDAMNWYPSLNTVGTAGTANEVEQDYGPANASPFTIGQKIVGSFNRVGDIDFYKFNATQGKTYTFWCDSIPSSLYSMRVICSDDTTRLNLAGDLDPPADNQNAFIVWSCPKTGQYFVRMFSNIPGNTGTGSYYEILTGENAPWTGPGRDQRDIVVVSSADGLTFPAPGGGTRVNTDPPYFDNWLPEVAVAGDGRVYAFWYGFYEAPDTTCGGESHLYLARSDNGGASFSDVGRVTDAISPWTRTFSNIQPNQGDYLALFANDLNLYSAWSDARYGNPDVFALALPLTSTPTLVSLANADAQEDRVTLTWYAASSQVSEAYVYRLEGQDWILKGVIDRDGQDRLTYVDTDVYPGVRYSYRLGIRDGMVERYMGEVSVVVPSLQKLRIESVRPNPTVNDVWVSFTLPQPGSAMLSLIDITGRRLRWREVGSLGPGKHLLNLTAGTHLPTGVYVVRLEQAGKVLAARVSVVR